MNSSHSGGKLNGKRVPPRLTGDASPNAKLSAKLVATIRERIAGGETAAEVARDLRISYGMAYKVARGETWREETDGASLIPDRRRPIGRRLRDKLFGLKRKRNASNAKLARAAGLSESSVARAMRDAHALLAARCQRMLMTSGSNEAAMATFQLTHDEAEALITYAGTHKLPKRLKQELEDDS